MKRLIFLISLLLAGQVSANTKTVVIGDSTYFNYAHTSTIDSAQLILIRGTVNDTLSLMPITGSSHKLVEWEDIFNQVDSAGNYQVWIEPYSSDAIIDTILGDCQVELPPLTTSDNIGINWNDVSTPNANVNLSNTTVRWVGNVSILRTGAIGDSSFGANSITDDATKASMWDEMWEYDTSYVSTGMGQMLKDTSAYQGAGSSAEGIKDAVWGQAADTAFAAGSMGDSAKVWGRIGGSGPRLCSLFVSDANDKAITDGSTRMTSGATTYTADISGDGFAVYSLTDATWKMLAYATGFVQDTIPQTFTVSASFKDTLTMTVVSIPNPSGADKVTCSIDTYDIMGALVENAKLTATVSDNGPWFAVDDSSAIMIPKTVSARTNSSGRATIELWESAEVRNEKGDNPTFNFILEKSRHFKWSIEDRSTPDADTWKIR